MRGFNIRRGNTTVQRREGEGRSGPSIVLVASLLAVVVDVTSTDLNQSVNLALGQPTWQSSVHSLCTQCQSDRAVDGNDNSSTQFDSSCLFVEDEDSSWWAVDIGTFGATVQYVIVTNRSEGCDFNDCSESNDNCSEACENIEESYYCSCEHDSMQWQTDYQHCNDYSVTIVLLSVWAVISVFVIIVLTVNACNHRQRREVEVTLSPQSPNIVTNQESYIGWRQQ